MKKALITGITGQDGSYLAEFLLEKEYEVHGIVRRVSTFNRQRIEHLMADTEADIYKEKKFFIHYGDLTDSSSLHRIMRDIQPDELYHLGAQSHVRVSFDIPEFTGNTTALSTTRLLEAIRHDSPKTRFYQASSSEMFGKVQEVPQKETTSFYPRSPYGIAKVYAYWMAVNYRESYNLFACNGILFNHESPRRGENFVTRKITSGLVEIKKGKKEVLYLGNLNAKRDWGYAKDYVEGMWLMLQQDKPDDYILATNETHTVREFVEEVCKLLDFDLVWDEKGIDEKGIDKKTGKTIIKIDPKYFRPAEVDVLIGDYSKAKEKLGWEPKVKFKELVKIMVEAELKGNI
ncbi:GDP-mannose 4,6-dehydratase [Candidatus Wolfebacteria bacterium]|nr:GDP-mannose 4,6-dehydratase [Candidatus Wolfebacteria bacterium]